MLSGLVSIYVPDVVVSERPSISLTQQAVMVVAGGDATLECHALGTPLPTVTWQKGKYMDLQDLMQSNCIGLL